MRYLPLAALALLALLLSSAPLRAEDKPVDARALVQRLLATGGPADQADLIADIVDLAPDVADVAAWVKEGVAYDDEVSKGWLEETNLCTDDVERNYLLYVPEDYSPEQKYRLIVDMHGGVSRPQQLSHAELEQMKFFWGDHAQEHGYLLALPAGQGGCEWWSEVGARHVLDVVRTVKRRYNVDDDRVFATGFSDGGSGAFYLALAHATPFAGFIPLNGHLAVTQAQGLQVHLANLRNRPLYVVNTEKDSLYPAASVGPIVDAMAPLGIDVLWHVIPELTHNPMYMAKERPVIGAWLDQTKREARPSTVTWQGTEGAPHRIDWIDVVKVTDADDGAEFPDPNPLLPPGRVRIGVNIEQTFTGLGVLVSGISDDSPAAAMGVAEGDVIVGLDEATIGGIRDLRAALDGKSHGDAFVLRVRRGEETLALEGAFPAASPRPVFERTKPWAALLAQAGGNGIEVDARGVAAFDVYLDAEQTRGGDLIVRVNGEEVHHAPVAPDLAFLLTQAVADQDRSKVYTARLRIEVPAADAATGTDD